MEGSCRVEKVVLRYILRASDWGERRGRVEALVSEAPR